MNLTDSRLAQAGNERLELAMLSFFEQFRKIYIGDQVQKSSKVSLLNILHFYAIRVKLISHLSAAKLTLSCLKSSCPFLRDLVLSMGHRGPC